MIRVKANHSDVDCGNPKETVQTLQRNNKPYFLEVREAIINGGVWPISYLYFFCPKDPTFDPKNTVSIYIIVFEVWKGIKKSIELQRAID